MHHLCPSISICAPFVPQDFGLCPVCAQHFYFCSNCAPFVLQGTTVNPSGNLSGTRTALSTPGTHFASSGSTLKAKFPNVLGHSRSEVSATWAATESFRTYLSRYCLAFVKIQEFPEAHTTNMEFQVFGMCLCWSGTSPPRSRVCAFKICPNVV